MKFYNLTFSSKNKNLLNDAFLFFKTNSISELNVLKKYFNKRKKIKRLTILKSPHVNKIAQESFEIRTFSRQLNVYSPKNLKYLIFLKKMKNNLFFNIFLKVQFFLQKNHESDYILNILNPNNFHINKIFFKSQKALKKQKHLKFKKIKSFIKIFDAYGEIKKISILCLDSSVGRAKD